MKQVFQRGFTVLFCLLLGLIVHAQKKKKNEVPGLEESTPTSSISNKPKSAKDVPKTKNYKLIYVSSPEKVLYGNPCAYQATHDFGFEYIVEPKNRGAARSRTQSGKFINNLWVKTGLVVRRSPFWKMILNGKFKKCQQTTGDFVG